MSAFSRARVDGRTARSLRSRQAVVEALLDLLEGGNLRPTAAQIAERAGLGTFDKDDFDIWLSTEYFSPQRRFVRSSSP
ncbi:MAG: hypothetical protein ABGY42_08390, partial [bacterium]